MKKRNKKRQRRLRTAAYIIEAVMFVTAIGFAVSDAQAAKSAQYIEDTAFPVTTVVETTEAVKRANFEVTEGNEQETSEEGDEETEPFLSGDAETKSEGESDDAHIETETAPVQSSTEASYEEVPYYSYKGNEPLDHRLQYHLYDLWQRFDLPEEWYIYAIGLIYQECGFHRDSVHHNPDGSSDVGFFQYNTRWFSGTAAKFGRPDLDINNNFHQAYLFVVQTKHRMNQGLSLEECISRHRRGDYDGYDAEYVSLVFQRTANLIQE